MAQCRSRRMAGEAHATMYLFQPRPPMGRGNSDEKVSGIFTPRIEKMPAAKKEGKLLWERSASLFQSAPGTTIHAGG